MQAIKFSCNDSYKQMLAPAGSDPRQLPVAFKLLAGSLSGVTRGWPRWHWHWQPPCSLFACILLVPSFGHVRARVKCVR